MGEVEVFSQSDRHKNHYFSHKSLVSSDQIHFDEQILISVFPNPTHGIFTLKAPIDSGFYLRDVHGKEILKGTMNEGQMELNISELSQGIYSLEVHHLDGVYNYKVVKK